MTHPAERELGITAEDIKYLKEYRLGRIRTLPSLSDPDRTIWNRLKSGDSDFGEYAEYLRERDMDVDDIFERRSMEVHGDAVGRYGTMHIRYGTARLVGEDAFHLQLNEINVHFDRFDVVLFPVMHFIFDSKWQDWIWRAH